MSALSFASPDRHPDSGADGVDRPDGGGRADATAEDVPASPASAPSPAALAPSPAAAPAAAPASETRVEKPGGAVVDIRARVFARSELRSVDDSPATFDLSLPSARALIRIRWRKWLAVVLEPELAGRFVVKDAYVQARSKRWELRTGQFKMPISALAQESPWALPLADRGLLHDVLLDRMQIAGRRPGAEVEWRVPGGAKARVKLGAFQGSDATGQLLNRASLHSQTPAAHVSLSPADVKVAVFGEWRTAEPVGGGGLARFPAGGASVTLDTELGGSGLRAWAESLVGASWIDEDPFDAVDATFAAGRVVAAFRRGGLRQGEPYGEVFSMAGVLDPDIEIASDLVWEAAAGVNIGYWRIVRLTLELAAWRRSRNTPDLLQVVNRDAALVQVGAMF